MYLLILEAFTYNYCIVTLFTSHYVSINSIMKCNVLLILKHLHPTMYLLIQATPNQREEIKAIYIPLCIY